MNTGQGCSVFVTISVCVVILLGCHSEQREESLTLSGLQRWVRGNSQRFLQKTQDRLFALLRMTGLEIWFVVYSFLTDAERTRWRRRRRDVFDNRPRRAVPIPSRR